MKTHQVSRMKLASVTAVLLVVGAFSANTAFAGGFMADIVNVAAPLDGAPLVNEFNPNKLVGCFDGPLDSVDMKTLEYLLP